MALNNAGHLGDGVRVVWWRAGAVESDLLERGGSGEFSVLPPD